MGFLGPLLFLSSGWDPHLLTALSLTWTGVDPNLNSHCYTPCAQLSGQPDEYSDVLTLSHFMSTLFSFQSRRAS